MNGRTEKEEIFKTKMMEKLKDLPSIFSKFYFWMEAKDMSYTTIRNYINHNIQFMNFLNDSSENFYEKVVEEDIDRYMVSIKRIKKGEEIVEVGDDIRASKWSSLNTFFRFLMQKKYLEKNPMEYSQRPKIKTEHEIVYLTKDEINLVLNQVKKTGRPMTKNRDLCIMGLFLTTGMRVSAITNINLSDVDFEENKIKVIEKERKTRYMPMGENFKILLEKWLKDREKMFSGAETDALFLSQRMNRISVDAVEGLVKKYTKIIPKKITPHKLRSSVAMNLCGDGVDVLTISSLLGHEDIGTTKRYVEAYESKVNSAMSLLDNII